MHAPHTPLPQTRFVPQAAPFGLLTPLSTQTADPPVHEICPAWQALAGVQLTPAVHAPHTPLLQTRLAPQAVPFCWLAPVSTQTADPLVHVICPRRQAFPGAQLTPAVHEPHTPLSHTRFVPQVVPFCWLAPVSTQTGAPPVHEIRPVWQALAAAQIAPAVHAPHTPFSHTRFAPQMMPFCWSAPVSTQTASPLEHDICPT